MSGKTISIVVPVYNEEEVLLNFYKKINEVLGRLNDFLFEILFVNDGSRDSSLVIIEKMCDLDPRCGLINLSRNFGKEIAMTAGLDLAKGDAVIIIDADLQDPPELITDFIREWIHGYDIVYAKRIERNGESWVKKLTASAFYWVMDKASGTVKIPRDTGDYRLMSRRSVDALLQLREQHRFMKGLFAWVGFPSKAIEYKRDSRAAGKTKFNYWKLWNFALEGITSFTVAPMKLATYVGILTAITTFLFATWVFTKTLIWGEEVAGYPTLLISVLFIGGLQLFFIGVIGEYLGRIFGEVKGRPLYIVEKHRAANSVVQ